MSFLLADSPDDVSRLRDVFRVTGFTATGVAEVIGPNGFGFLTREELGPLLRRTAGGSPLETFIRLFMCGVSVARDDAERAFGPLSLEALADAQILRLDGEDVAGGLSLMPVDQFGCQFLVPSDCTNAPARTPDFVVGVGPASMTLAGLTIRQPAARCLDLGTGSGIQALFAQEHTGQVVATDRNTRALAFADFAMRLNGVGNVETRAGDLFEPVTSERFGLIVSNPPFVISPEERFVYRDSGLTGDEICRRIVTEAPAFLEDGGWCQLLANWAHDTTDNWQDRLSGWIEDLGCDAWIVQSKVEDAETYAARWIRHDQPDGAAAQLFAEWMAYYERIGLEAVGFGLITLRKTSRAHRWLCLEELAQEFVLPCGDQIAAAFERGVWLQEQGRDDRALLAARLVVSPDLNLRQSHFAAEGEWFLDDAVLALDHGLHYRASIDSFGAEVVAGCDGLTTVGALIERAAARVGVDASALSPHLLEHVRRLIQQGFVRPVD